MEAICCCWPPWNMPPRYCRLLLIFAEPSLWRCNLNLVLTDWGALGTLEDIGLVFPMGVPVSVGSRSKTCAGTSDEPSLPRF